MNSVQTSFLRWNMGTRTGILLVQEAKHKLVLLIKGKFVKTIRSCAEAIQGRTDTLDSLR